jgi:DNA-binding CsgD family transcriptional regulator
LIHAQLNLEKSNHVASVDVVEGTLLYEDDHLCAHTPDNNPCHLTVGKSLQQAANSFERRRIVQYQLREAGFDWLDYAHLQLRGTVLQPRSMLVSYSPGRLAKDYCMHRYWEVDGRLETASTLGAPYFWTVAQEQCRECQSALPRPHTLRLLNQLRECGIGSGMTLVLATPSLGQVAALHLLSRSHEISWDSTASQAGALTLGMGLHEFLSVGACLPTQAACTVHLSDIQLRIAVCIAHGLTDKEVARSLSLSSHVVDYHLRVLRQKFNVRNRVQLAQAINQDGLIK